MNCLRWSLKTHPAWHHLTGLPPQGWKLTASWQNMFQVFELDTHNWKYLLTCKTCRKCGSPGSLQLLTKTINRAACLLLSQQSSQVAVSSNSLQWNPEIYQIHEDLFQQACCGSKWVSPISTCQGSSCNLQAERNCFPGRHIFLARCLCNDLIFS